MRTESAYLCSPWRVEFRDTDLPDAPPPGEVLLKVEACGICGSDLSAAQTNKKFEPFGHEIAARIERLGPGVELLRPDLAVGQPVVLETSGFSPYSDLSRDGRVDLCRAAPGFWGRPAMGFSARMIAPTGCLVPYRESISPAVASLAEPAGVAIDMVKTARVSLGERVAVVGLGPIALMAIPLLLKSGAREVVCFGRTSNARRLKFAGRLGAKTVASDQPLDAQKDFHESFEHVLLTAPVETLPEALALLAFGGELTYIGIGTGSGKVTFDANNFHFRKLQLRASFASPALYFPTALKLLADGVIPGEEIISHRFPLSSLQEAMHLCRDRKSDVLKVIIEP